MSNNEIVSISNAADFDAILLKSNKGLSVVHFYAPWAPQCQQIDEVLSELCKVGIAAKFVKIEAETFPSISNKYNITAVPTCILLQGSTEVDRVNGVNAAELTKKVQKHAGVVSSNSASTAALSAAPSSSLNDRLKTLVNSAPVMIFMKGNPDQPRCGFSRTLVQILAEQKVTYSSFDILSDEDVRQGLKEYSNWPTYPQIYVKGELIGGLDILKELIANGELQSMLPATGGTSLEDRLKALVSREPVMLFMKGSPDSPQCGFSKSIVAILNSKGVKYGHFDILKDEEIRQGLKAFSNWPTYPQVYVRGELIGGLDIVKEMNDSGDLDNALKPLVS